MENISGEGGRGDGNKRGGMQNGGGGLSGAKYRTCGPEITTEQTTFKTGNLNFKIGDGGLEGRMVKESNKGLISEQEEAKFRIGADV